MARRRKVRGSEAQGWGMVKGKRGAVSPGLPRCSPRSNLDLRALVERHGLWGRGTSTARFPPRFTFKPIRMNVRMRYQAPGRHRGPPAPSQVFFFCNVSMARLRKPGQSEGAGVTSSAPEPSEGQRTVQERSAGCSGHHAATAAPGVPW